MNDHQCCRDLWREVILNAVENTEGRNMGGSNVNYALEVMEADMWFRNASDDFKTVCALAGWDWEWIRDNYLAGNIDVEMIRNKGGWTSGRDRRSEELRGVAKFAHLRGGKVAS